MGDGYMKRFEECTNRIDEWMKGIYGQRELAKGQRELKNELRELMNKEK